MRREDDNLEEEKASGKEHTFKVEVPEDALNEALRAVERREAERPDEGQVLENKITELEAALQAKTNEAADYKDKYVRSVAEMDNMRKRMLREKEEARHFGAENLLRDLLVVIDNLERAAEASGDANQIKEGVRLTHDQFKSILRRHGVEVVEAAGSPFDPARHEAVAHVVSEAHAPGTVIEEHRRGYLFRDRLLRPSMVSVAKAPEPPAANEGDNQVP